MYVCVCVYEILLKLSQWFLSFTSQTKITFTQGYVLAKHLSLCDPASQRSLFALMAIYG